MWVSLPAWMIMDGEPSLPVQGSVVPAVGIRVRGEPTGARPGVTDGIVQVNPGADPESRDVEYALTGTAGPARDYGAHDEHAGAEFELTVNRDRFQVQFDGEAGQVSPGSRVTVRGRLTMVGAYEWDAFRLSDTRSDWLVDSVVVLDTGDAMVDLVARPSH